MSVSPTACRDSLSATMANGLAIATAMAIAVFRAHSAGEGFSQPPPQH